MPPRPRRQLPVPRARPAPPRLDVDWPSYFRDFCRAHEVAGGGPVVDGGVLLFGDGWRYALDAYEGPEYPPPADLEHLLDLQRRYWRRRLQVVRAERDGLAHGLEGLNNLQRDRAVPLQVRRYLADEGGRELPDPDRPVGEPDWDALVERLRWLAGDVATCERELLALGETP